jgi:hypothetical protein
VCTTLRPSIALQTSYGILTVCPSGAAFAIPLGPTNPRLITSAAETSVFRRAGISPALWLLVPAFSLPNAPLWVTPLASSRIGTLSYRAAQNCATPAVSVLCLAPIIFGARTLDE